MEEQQLSVSDLIEKLEQEGSLDLGHFGKLRVNSRGGVFLDNISMLVQPKILDEKEIFNILTRYIDKIKNPPKFSPEKKRPANLSALKNMVK